MKDQIEILAHERQATPQGPPVKDVLESLPVQSQERRQSLLDSVAREEEDPVPPGETPFVQGFEATLTWIAYVAIMAVALLLTWSVGTSILKYMTW